MQTCGRGAAIADALKSRDSRAGAAPPLADIRRPLDRRSNACGACRGEVGESAACDGRNACGRFRLIETVRTRVREAADHRDLALLVRKTLAAIDRLRTRWFVGLSAPDTTKRVDCFLTGDPLFLPSFDGRASLL